MSRHARLDAAGLLHQVIVRGIERTSIFAASQMSASSGQVSSSSEELANLATNLQRTVQQFKM